MSSHLFKLDEIGCDVRELRRLTSESSRESFSFFARRVLGLHLSKFRCDGLQRGLPTRTPVEEKALRRWEALREGRRDEALQSLPAFLQVMVA